MKDCRKLVIVSYRAGDELVQFLEDLSFRVIRSMEIGVDENINDHVDLQVFKLDDRRIIVSPSTYDYYLNELKEFNIEVIRGEKDPRVGYPNEIIYNISTFNNLYIHKKGYIDKRIEKALKDLGYEPIYVRQGYARCSSMEVGKMLLTSDKNIYKTIRSKGLKSLLLTQEGIRLRGYDEGFFGGTCGMISNDKICFTGNIEDYPSFDILNKYFLDNNIGTFYPKSLELTDLGGLIFLGGDCE